MLREQCYLLRLDVGCWSKIGFKKSENELKQKDQEKVTVLLLFLEILKLPHISKAAITNMLLLLLSLLLLLGL